MTQKNWLREINRITHSQNEIQLDPSRKAPCTCAMGGDSMEDGPAYLRCTHLQEYLQYQEFTPKSLKLV